MLKGCFCYLDEVTWTLKKGCPYMSMCVVRVSCEDRGMACVLFVRLPSVSKVFTQETVHITMFLSLKDELMALCAFASCGESQHGIAFCYFHACVTSNCVCGCRSRNGIKGFWKYRVIGVCASVVECNRRGRTNGYLFADCLADCSGVLREDAI